MEYENVLLVKSEVFVYRIPPRQSNRGYRAADWGLDSPCWTGRLRVVAKGKDLTIKLEDRNTGELFAACPVDAYPGIAVEPVLDSSRYFVIRLVADDGRTMFTGIGFSERSDSFDLNVAIQDHFKWLKQEQEAEEANKNLASRPSLDLGFKEGERIKLNLNTRRTGDEPSSGAASTRPKPAIRSGNNPVGLLPPPPAPSVSRTRGNRTVGQHTAPVVAVPKDNPGSLTDVPSNQPTTQATSCNTSGSSNVDLLADIFGTGK